MSDLDPITQHLLDAGVLARHPGAVGPGPVAHHVMHMLFCMGVPLPTLESAKAFQAILGESYTDEDFKVPDAWPPTPEAGS